MYFIFGTPAVVSALRRIPQHVHLTESLAEVQPDADMTVALGASISVSRSELRWLGQLTPP